VDIAQADDLRARMLVVGSRPANSRLPRGAQASVLTVIDGEFPRQKPRGIADSVSAMR